MLVPLDGTLVKNAAMFYFPAIEHIEMLTAQSEYLLKQLKNSFFSPFFHHF
ncbi:hypothetical protein CU008_1057 [Enterococcus faecium]|nr:hypothetical protein [Enterococcus faecium]